jgi:hypothetical protein
MDHVSLSSDLEVCLFSQCVCVLNIELGSKPSHIGRSSCQGRDMLKLGPIRRIGDAATM